MAFLVNGVCALAQSSGTTTADLKGRVTDDKALPLPGVTVTATNKQTGAMRSTVTKIDGDYAINLLPPGVYTVKAELSLFTPAQYDGVRLSLGATTPLDFSMSAAAGATAAVEVTAETPLIDPNKTDLSQVVDQAKITQLPNVARNFLSFSLITPRVAEDRGPQSGSAGTSGFSINGQSARLNNVAVDGMDNNDQATGSVRATFSQDAVQEYQVITNPYGAEFGRTAGGVINIITKSGTNELHGGAFYYYRSDALATEDPLTNVKIPLKDNRFGLNFGGPVVKDKMFFFVAAERTKTDTANAVTIADADIALIRSKGFTIENGNVDYAQQNTNVVFKLDGQLGSSNSLQFRGNYSKIDDENAQAFGGLRAKSSGGQRIAKDFAGALSFTSILGTSSYNEFRGLYADSQTDINQLDQSYGIAVSLPGVASFGTDRLLPQFRNGKIYQLFDAFSFELDQKGHVRLKVGAEYIHSKLDGALPNFFAGLYRFSAIPANALFAGQPALSVRQAFAGIPSVPSLAQGIPAVFVQAFGNPAGGGTTSQFGGFIQADLQVAPTFLVRAGARYDYEDPIDPYGTDSNIAPRLSFSWSLSDSARIKGGAGRFFGVAAFGPMFAVQIQDEIGSEVRTQVRGLGVGPASASPLVPWNILPGRRFPNATAAGTGVIPPFVLRAGNYRSPQTDMASLGVELELGKKVLATVDGAAARGKYVFVARNINPVTNPTGSPATQRPDPRYGDIFLYESIGQSWYKSLSLGLQTRLGGPFETSFFYTRTDAEDDYIDWLTEFQPQDPLNPQLEKGPSVQSPENKILVTATYSTVGRSSNAFLRDWTFGTIIEWKNGLPYNVTAGFDRNANGDPVSDRPVGVGRNSGDLGSQFTLDLRISRQIYLVDTFGVELVAVCTNLTNHDNVVQRNGVAFASPGVANPDFDKPTLYGPSRLFQIGARLFF
ncbi:MAG: TonB-dependent receptor [Acidobacteria bacterium]|nr:TonB-dependent receptor [Acidobacteriota bacterium]